MKARPAREQVVGHDPQAEQLGPRALLGSLAGWFHRTFDLERLSWVKLLPIRLVLVESIIARLSRLKIW